MIRIARFAVPAAMLLLAACGGGNDQKTAAPPPDSADMVKATSAIPGALGRAPGYAQQGVDSANAAAAQRDADVDALSREASGAGSGAAGTTAP